MASGRYSSTLLLAFLSHAPQAAAQEPTALIDAPEVAGISYVSGDVPFVTVEDVNRQAEAWATCAATYNVSSKAFRTLNEPTTAEELNNLGNGAEMAVAMTLIANLAKQVGPEATPDSMIKFNATWTYAKVAMVEWPKTQETSIWAELERVQADDRIGITQFFANLAATVTVCRDNSDSQQMYVDMWHSLATSGLLQFPPE
jgi:hypothetical protein